MSGLKVLKRAQRIWCPRDVGGRPITLNLSNPLTRGLRHFYVGSGFESAWPRRAHTLPGENKIIPNYINLATVNGAGVGGSGSNSHSYRAEGANFSTGLVSSYGGSYGVIGGTEQQESFAIGCGGLDLTDTYAATAGWYTSTTQYMYFQHRSDYSGFWYYVFGGDWGADGGGENTVTRRHYDFVFTRDHSTAANDGITYYDGVAATNTNTYTTKTGNVCGTGCIFTAFNGYGASSATANEWISYACAWNRQLTADEIAEFHRNPFDCIQVEPTTLYFISPSFWNAYALSLDGSTYAWAPEQIGPISAAQRKLSSEGSSYAVTGTAATAARTRALVAAGSTYAVTGTAAAEVATRKLALAGSTYAVTGAADTLQRFAKLALGGSSYALTGTAVTEVAARQLALAGSSYAMTGAAATPAAQRKLALAGSSYAYTGTAATMVAARVVTCEGGTYTITGASATLAKSGTMAYYLTADGSTYAVTGANATTARGLKLIASGGSYLLVGSDSGVVIARKIALAGSSYAVTGGAQTYKRGLVLSAGGGVITITGADETGAAQRKLAAAGSTYAVTGAVDTLARGLALTAAGGAYTLVGGAQTYTYIRHIVMTMDGGTYVLTGGSITAAYGFSGQERRWDITLYYPPGTILATGWVDSGLVPREKVTDTRDYDFDYCADPATLPVPLINYDVGYSSIRQPVVLRGFTNDPITVETVEGRPLQLTRRGIASTAIRMLGARDVWLKLYRDGTFDMVKADRTEISGTFTVGGSYRAP